MQCGNCHGYWVTKQQLQEIVCRRVMQFPDEAKRQFKLREPSHAVPDKEFSRDLVCPEALALACSSHSGTPRHAATAAAMLAALGLDETALACGAHWPLHDASARDLARSAAAPSALHNNCSGKHAGFLAVARHLGFSVAGYEKRMGGHRGTQPRGRSGTVGG